MWHKLFFLFGVNLTRFFEINFFPAKTDNYDLFWGKRRKIPICGWWLNGYGLLLYPKMGINPHGNQGIQVGLGLPKWEEDMKSLQSAYS